MTLLFSTYNVCESEVHTVGLIVLYSTSLSLYDLHNPKYSILYFYTETIFDMVSLDRPHEFIFVNRLQSNKEKERPKHDWTLLKSLVIEVAMSQSVLLSATMVFYMFHSGHITPAPSKIYGQSKRYFI